MRKLLEECVSLYCCWLLTYSYTQHTGKCQRASAAALFWFYYQLQHCRATVRQIHTQMQLPKCEHSDDYDKSRNMSRMKSYIHLIKCLRDRIKKIHQVSLLAPALQQSYTSTNLVRPRRLIFTHKCISQITYVKNILDDDT